jgi:acetyltransferase-like isoleucine patch superfamily enzyme
MLLRSDVIADISTDSEFNLKGRLQFGMRNPGASHPEEGRSVFTTEPGAKVEHTGDKHAIIGPKSVVHVEGELSLGDCRMNSNVRLICGERIEIGDRVDLSWDVVLLDDDRHTLKINGEEKRQTAPIEIGDDVGVGHSVSTPKGVTIGDGSIVASNSVVTDDVPEQTIVAGHPAEPIASGDIEWSY